MASVGRGGRLRSCSCHCRGGALQKILIQQFDHARGMYLSNSRTGTGTCIARICYIPFDFISINPQPLCLLLVNNLKGDFHKAP